MAAVSPCEVVPLPGPLVHHLGEHVLDAVVLANALPHLNRLFEDKRVAYIYINIPTHTHTTHTLTHKHTVEREGFCAEDAGARVAPAKCPLEWRAAAVVDDDGRVEGSAGAYVVG